MLGSPAGNSGNAAARVEQALSEVASSISGFQPKPGPKFVWLLQLHIWLLVVELYLKLGQLKEAEASINEASTLFPLSHQLMVMVCFCYLFFMPKAWSLKFPKLMYFVIKNHMYLI